MLVGTEFLGAADDWMHTVMLEGLHTVAAHDLTIWTITDDLDEVMEIVESGILTQARQRLERTGHERPTPEEKLQKATRPMAGTEQ